MTQEEWDALRPGDLIRDARGNIRPPGTLGTITVTDDWGAKAVYFMDARFRYSVSLPDLYDLATDLTEEEETWLMQRNLA